MKRILSLALTLLCLTFGFLTMEAQAAETSGTCGENVTWVYDEETKTLTISGEGEMTDYPWNAYRDHIRHVIVEDGVTSVCMYAFESYSGLESVFLGELHDGLPSCPLLQHTGGVLLHHVEAFLHLSACFLCEEGVQEAIIICVGEPLDILWPFQGVVKFLVLVVFHRITGRGSCTGPQQRR